ncbi:hypothetical protein GC175_01835 [bacterium]|nr:hypothetical protein [bacterium]
MSNLQKQISALFEDIDPDLHEVITQVLLVEEELISYERPRYKERFDLILDRVAKRALKDEQANAD